MTKAIKATLFVLGAAVAIGACAPVIHSVPTDPVARATAHARPSATVQLYVARTPSCEYEEIAFIEGNSRFGSASETLEQMRSEAAQYGADALVLIDHADGSEEGSSDNTHHHYSAVAVSFAGGVCG